jgi:lysophospholipase L1-like esterase
MWKSWVAAPVIAATLTLSLACSSPSAPTPAPVISAPPPQEPTASAPPEPPAIPVPEPAPAPLPRLSRNRILAFGDSITVGEMVVPNTDDVILEPAPASSYPTVLSMLLRERYGSLPAVFNAGLSGEKAAYGDRRLPFEIGKFNPDAVVLLEGYNDLLYADPAQGIQAAELGMSVLAAEARNRGTRVFICTLSPTKPGRRQIPLATIQAANDRLRAVARGEGAYLIDVFSALLPDLNNNLGSDGLHPSQLGYRRIAETVFASLRADLEVR